jgi:predicted GIY-YIG superfamily endonuclease
MELPNGWACYLLLCSDDSFYCGMTSNLRGRLRQHRSGKGSEYTKGTRPLALVWYEAAASRNEAAARERQIKNWKHMKKRSLQEGTLMLSDRAQSVWVSLD